MGKTSVTLQGEQNQSSDAEAEADVLESPPEELDEGKVRYLSDEEVEALREKVLHHDFMNA